MYMFDDALPDCSLFRIVYAGTVWSDPPLCRHGGQFGQDQANVASRLLHRLRIVLMVIPWRRHFCTGFLQEDYTSGYSNPTQPHRCKQRWRGDNGFRVTGFLHVPTVDRFTKADVAEFEIVVADPAAACE